MKAETTEWVQKAEGDINTAQREFAVQEEPNHDAVCFHAQQCAEKYLKARLIEEGLPVNQGRIHATAKNFPAVQVLPPMGSPVPNAASV